MFVKVVDKDGDEYFVNPHQVSLIIPLRDYDEDEVDVGSIIQCGGRTIRTNESAKSLIDRFRAGER